MAKLTPAERAQDAAVRLAMADLSRAAKAAEVAASIWVEAYAAFGKALDHVSTLAAANPRCGEVKGDRLTLASQELARQYDRGRPEDDRYIPEGARRSVGRRGELVSAQPLSEHCRELAKAIL